MLTAFRYSLVPTLARIAVYALVITHMVGGCCIHHSHSAAAGESEPHGPNAAVGCLSGGHGGCDDAPHGDPIDRHHLPAGPRDCEHDNCQLLANPPRSGDTLSLVTLATHLQPEPPEAAPSATPMATAFPQDPHRHGSVAMRILKQAFRL